MVDGVDPKERKEDWADWLHAEPSTEPVDPKGAVARPAAYLVADLAAAKPPKLEFQEALAPPPDRKDVTDPGGIPNPSRPPVRAAAALAGPSVAPTRQRRKRPSRWDRPPEPHDWRWIVGHIGRGLITLGLLMFGFVAYQLWGTGIQTARAQDHLKAAFETKLHALPSAPDTIVASTAGATTIPATTIPATTVPATTVAGAPGSTVSPSTTVAPATTTTVAGPPARQNYGLVKDGDGIGRITIPKISVDFYYVAGVSKDDLDRAVGHFPESVVPGQLGNAALAGHRTSHKAPFGDLDELKPGDEIDIETVLGGAYVYIVTGSEVVEPSDYHVVTDKPMPNTATLTLITCTPKWTSKQRLVIHSTLDASRSSAVGIGETYYGEANPDASLGGATLPDDNGLSADGTSTSAANSATTAATSLTTVTAPTAIAETTNPAVALPADPVATTLPTTTLVGNTTTIRAAAATTAPSTVSRVGVVSQFADDAFQQGWFDDGAAWPHVLGWAALFGLVWFACYQLARRYRNLLLGIAVSIVPIVVVLYFLYENINRLLPAAI